MGGLFLGHEERFACSNVAQIKRYRMVVLARQFTSATLPITRTDKDVKVCTRSIGHTLFFPPLSKLRPELFEDLEPDFFSVHRRTFCVFETLRRNLDEAVANAFVRDNQDKGTARRSFTLVNTHPLNVGEHVPKKDSDSFQVIL